MSFLLKILAWIGPGVLKALYDVLQREAAKLYAAHKQDVIKIVDAVSTLDAPGTTKIAVAVSQLQKLLKTTMGEAVNDIPVSDINWVIETGYQAWKAQQAKETTK